MADGIVMRKFTMPKPILFNGNYRKLKEKNSIFQSN
jgi:hypothetical protein